MKVAVVGVGRMGRRHVRIARELGLEVKAVADRAEASLIAASSEFTLPKEALFVDAIGMLRKTRPEIVVVATTSPTHCEYTLAAVENGARFILCEKPMAVSLAQCDRMIEACAKAGTKLAINHPMRFMPQYIEARRILDTELGGLSGMTVIAGNFGLAMNGSHYFEAFRYLTGETPVKIAAWFSSAKIPNPRGAEFEDRAGTIRAVSASGKRLTIDASADQGHGLFVAYMGPHGRLTNDQLAGTMHLQVRQVVHRAEPTTRYDMPWVDRSISVAPTDAFAPTRSVLKALLDGMEAPSAEDGYAAVRALVTAYASHERGHACVSTFDPTLSRDRTFSWA